MKTPLHQQQRVLPQKVRYRAGVAALEQLPFILQDEPVRFRVGREHRRLAKYVGCEYRTEPLHPHINEGLRVLSFVCSYELQGLPKKGQAEASRRQPQPPAPGPFYNKENDCGNGNIKNKIIDKSKTRHGNKKIN